MLSKKHFIKLDKIHKTALLFFKVIDIMSI